MRLTTENGEVAERVFTGAITSLEDIDKLFKEVREEFTSKEGWDTMFLEIWHQTQNKNRTNHHGRQALTRRANMNTPPQW